ncbi:MAG: ABC transporter permease subunit [Dehalococcoidales bacterium]|nr:ABC transporter permease subunit [Dehalococcoidales bacterium]
MKSSTISGLLTIFHKELSDIFTSWRFIILFLIVFVVGIGVVWSAAQYIREEVVDAQFVFLQLYTTSSPLPFFTLFIAIIMPLVGIILAFDAINSERNNGTMSRLLSQPIYRDSVINGKFMAGVVTMGIMLTALVLLVGGIGLRMIGVPPTSEEAVRLMAFLIISVIYGAFWLGLAMLFSIFFRRVATSALASIAIWLLSIFLFLVLFVQTEQSGLGLAVSQISPVTVFWQVIYILLVPGARTLSQVTQSNVTVPSSALSVGQSLLIVWPYLMSILMLTVICFAASYIKFMREEIRST